MYNLSFQFKHCSKNLKYEFVLKHDNFGHLTFVLFKFTIYIFVWFIIYSLYNLLFIVFL